MLPIYLIAALSENGVIGKEGKMPWHLPSDLQYFKKITSGNPILMGRKTWESIGCKALPNRINIVLTRQQNLVEKKGVFFVSTLEEGYACAQDFSQKAGLETKFEGLFIIGGATLYEQTLPHAKKLFLTKVLAILEGDTYFPAFEEECFCKSVSHFQKAGPNDTHDMCFQVFERKKI